MPEIHVGVGHGREYVLGQLGGEGLACLGVLQVPVLDSELHERDMLFGAQQDLKRFPAREAPVGQCGYGRRSEVIVGGLKSVLTASDLPDVGDGRVRHLYEEGYCDDGINECTTRGVRVGLRTVIVAADSLVEGGKLLGR